MNSSEVIFLGGIHGVGKIKPIKRSPLNPSFIFVIGEL
jgi:hypothetical protein